jgi:Flp pilus assembly protein TadG
MARKNENKKAQGFLSRLRRDEAGNVLMIMGASLIPMLAIIGGTVDISRGYMVKVRLQQACDAGALGGRQAVGEGTFNANAAARAQALFNANFPANYQGSTGTVFTPNSTDGGITVKGTATTTMPTVIMGLFKDEPELKGLKTQSILLTTECNAKMDVSNSDVSMVLDTTGSMKCPNDTNDSQCGSYLGSTNAEASNSRMAALKTATSNFVSILNAAATSSTARVRFSIVPFAQTVNTGKLLYAVNPNYIVGGNANENWNYQSRRPVYRATGTTTTLETLQFSGYTSSVVRDVYCTAFAANEDTGGYGSNNNSTWVTAWRYPSDYGFSGSGQNVTKSGDPGVTYTFSLNTWGPSSPSYNSGYNRKSCSRNVTRTTMVDTYDATAPGAVFSHYEYSQRSLPVSAYVASGLLGGSAVPDTFNKSSASVGAQRWAGCIQERDTVATNTPAFNAATKTMTTANMWDLDIDATPTSDVATRWRPYWPESSYVRYYYDKDVVGKAIYTNDVIRDNELGDGSYNGGYQPSVGCPYEAKALQKFTNAEFNTYIANLSPNSGTYHDIGALWGLRLASPEGIFAANVNATPPNNGYVSRHMIMMSDGQPGAYYLHSDAYGIEFYEKKITGDGSDTNLNNLHIARFKAICEAAKAKKIRVWFVAFGTTLSSDMTACASPNSTYSATNASQLNDAFVQIAQSIAELRLTK